MRTLGKSWHQFFVLFFVFLAFFVCVFFWPKNVTAQHLKHIAFKTTLHACVNVTVIGGYVYWSH